MRNKIAVFCARGGSKRVKRKNLTMIDGKPLIAYGIEIARKAGIFDQVIVNSEDQEIIDAAGLYGADTYNRPESLATDTTFVIEVVQEMISTLGLMPDDSVAVMFPTCPLTEPEDIKSAYKIFKENGCQSPVVSVTKYEYPIQVALEVNNDNRLQPVFKEAYKSSTRHNSHSASYRANYSVIFNSAGNFLNQKNLIGQFPIPYVMPLERSIDIDEPYQMELAKLMIEKRNKENA